jgi:hypothetical protein
VAALGDYSAISQAEARRIIVNWRDSHAYPLQVFYKHAKLHAKLCGGAVVAQRLKRIGSVMEELKLDYGAQLARMEDLGGCRIVVETAADLNGVVESYETSGARHKLVKKYDYIETPQKTGYRGVHLVFSFRGRRNGGYNGLMIEIQIRTRLQHMWEAAAEVLGRALDARLKDGRGNIRALRYMELAAYLLALEDGTAAWDRASRDAAAEEMRSLGDANVLEILDAAGMTLSSAAGDRGEAYYLLRADARTSTVEYAAFPKSRVGDALRRYSEDEAHGGADVVLALSTDVRELRAAYPGYFADVGEFVRKIRGYVSSDPSAVNGGREQGGPHV